MILEEALNKLLRDSVNLILEAPGFAIRARQTDAPAPIGPYASVAFVAEASDGWEQRTYANNQGDDDLTETIEGHRALTFSINFFRDSALDNAKRVKLRLLRQSILDLFISSEVGLGERSEVRQISEVEEEEWEERAQFDVTLHTVGVDSDIVRSILSLDMASVYQSRGLEYTEQIGVS